MEKNYYGPLYYWWDECEETVSIGEDLALELIKKERITGKTYIDVMSSEFGIPVIDLTEKEVKDLEYEIIPVKDEKLLKKVEDYFSWFKTFPFSNKKIEDFDNFVFVIRDDPTYSNSNKPYTTTTIVINKKESTPIIINIKHPIGMERNGLELDKYYDKKKVLIKEICDKKLV